MVIDLKTWQIIIIELVVGYSGYNNKEGGLCF
jgi:hypothetical protein